MEKETVGTVLSVKKQWWLKVNTKAFRTGPLDGATFPHIVKIQYVVDGKEYTLRKWYGASEIPPFVGAAIKVFYQEETPSNSRV